MELPHSPLQRKLWLRSLGGGFGEEGMIDDSGFRRRVCSARFCGAPSEVPVLRRSVG